MLEKEIERRLIKPIRAPGGLCLKFESPGYTGVPDRLILLPGAAVVFVETKQPGNKERARQLYVHEVLRALGFLVYNTVDTPEKVQRVCADCERMVRHGI